MTIHLGDILATVRCSGRNPSWSEYERSAPCDQRAIVKRWAEISNAPLTWDNTAGPGRDGRETATYNWHRAVMGCEHEDAPRARTIKDERCEDFERHDDWTENKVQPI